MGLLSGSKVVMGSTVLKIEQKQATGYRPECCW